MSKRNRHAPSTKTLTAIKSSAATADNVCVEIDSVATSTATITTYTHNTWPRTAIQEAATLFANYAQKCNDLQHASAQQIKQGE